MKDTDTVIEERVIQFMDIHNFSIAAKVMGGNHSAFLQETYVKLGDIIVSYSGEIIKYLGDALLCIYPAGSENDVVKCSKELRKTFGDLVSKRELPPETELEIGISSGRVELGVFGHKSLVQRDVFGEAVNRAAMIGHHRGIAMTETVYDRVKETYQTSELPEVKLKWLDEPLRVWEVVE